MKKRKPIFLIPLLIVFLAVGLLNQAWAAKSTNLMTKDELKNILANEDTYVLDVRTGRDWSSSEYKIQGAHRTDPGEFKTWASKFPQKGTLVLYCA